MKVAIIGGGTAGCIMAAHLTKYFPQFELYHIYASSIPNIGVGEGTTPSFKAWIDETIGLKFSDLQSRCNMTRKYAIQFENWGKKNPRFMHSFPREVYAYHFSATNLGELLKEHISANLIDKKVISIKSDGLTVKIGFEDTSYLEVDLAFDASGFPKSFENSQYTQISLIPTNAALIRRGSSIDSQSVTRSIARPHGWIFSIPLTNRTSYGYVYNSSINSRNEIEQDLNIFFKQENIDDFGDSKHLNFPNFISNTFFDGSLCKIGNSACFMEPLEATAIGLLLVEILLFAEYFLKDFGKIKTRAKFEQSKITKFNHLLSKLISKVAIFVGWHYKSGSCFDTKFWHYAKSNFEKEINTFEDKDIILIFNKYLEAASKLDYWQYCSLNINDLKHSFGGYSLDSFYEVGHGIGYLSKMSNSN